MRKSRLGMALLPLVLLLLSGCYESQSMLLDPSAARQPVQGGDWTETRGGDSYHDRMIARSDGWYDFYEQDVTTNGNWEHHVVLVNTLGVGSGYVQKVVTSRNCICPRRLTFPDAGYRFLSN